MIKIPGTPEGLPAIRQALEEGININITLLFAQSAYEKVAEAFLSALEARAAKGQDISQIASVASFFVSRIDTLVDSKIDEKLKTLRTPARKLSSKASAARWPLPMPGSLTHAPLRFCPRHPAGLEGVGKQLDAVHQKLVGHFLHEMPAWQGPPSSSRLLRHFDKAVATACRDRGRLTRSPEESCPQCLRRSVLRRTSHRDT